MTPQQKGGIAVREKHGTDWLRKIASHGGNTTVERYSVLYMKAIGSAGGLTTAARNRRRLYESGVSMGAALGQGGD